MASRLENAVRSGNIDDVRMCIKEGDDINFSENGDWPPIVWAASENYIHILEVFVEHNVDIDAVTNVRHATRGNTALMVAACNGHTDVITYLLKNGADVNAVNLQNKSARGWAMQFYKYAAAMLLESHGGEGGDQIPPDVVLALANAPKVVTAAAVPAPVPAPVPVSAAVAYTPTLIPVSVPVPALVQTRPAVVISTVPVYAAHVPVSIPVTMSAPSSLPQRVCAVPPAGVMAPVTAVPVPVPVSVPAPSPLIKEISYLPQQPVSAPPIHRVGAPPVQQYTAAPVQRVGAPPVQQYTAAPVQRVGAPPVQQYTAAPVQRVGAPPVQQYGVAPVSATQTQMSNPLPQYAQMPTPAGMPAGMPQMQMPAGAPSHAYQQQQQQLQQQHYQQCLLQQQQQQRSGTTSAVNGTAIAATALGAIAGVTLMAAGVGGGGSFFDGGESFAPVLHGLGSMGAMAGRSAYQGNRNTPAGHINTAVKGTIAAANVVSGLTNMFGGGGFGM